MKLNYLQLINRFWKLNRAYGYFTGHETQLYFKLLDICNHFNWRSFMRSNSYLCAETGMNESRLAAARKKLVEAGLIEYVSGKQKREPCTYTILSGNEADKALAVYSNSGSQSNSHSDSLSDSLSDSPSNSPSNSASNNLSNSLSNSPNVKKPGDNNRDIELNSDLNREIKENPEKEIMMTADNPDVFKKIMDDYNSVCPRLNRLKGLTELRMEAAGALLREYGYDKLLQVFKLADESDFLAGNNESGWKANFDWLMKPGNFLKVLEGYYANRQKNITSGNASPLEILEEIYNELIIDDEFTC